MKQLKQSLEDVERQMESRARRGKQVILETIELIGRAKHETGERLGETMGEIEKQMKVL